MAREMAILAWGVMPAMPVGRSGRREGIMMPFMACAACRAWPRAPGQLSPIRAAGLGRQVGSWERRAQVCVARGSIATVDMAAGGAGMGRSL